jgi:hypothetical protein
MMFDAEITLRAIREGYRILEFPVLWSNDPDTRFDPFKGSVTNLKELARIRWAMLRRTPTPAKPVDVRERTWDAQIEVSPSYDAAARVDDRSGVR